MRRGLQIALCFALAAGTAMAQRGGGGGMRGGGGFGGGGMRGGGGFGGGGMRGGGGFVGGGGGFVGGGGGFVGGGGGFRGGGFGGGGFKGGFGGNRFIFVNRGFGFGNRFGAGFWGWPWGWGWPAWGWGWDGGLGYWPSDYYSDSGYAGYPSYAGYPGYAGYGSAYSPSFGQSPNITVIYPPQQTTVVPDAARPVIREYDQFGQEIRPGGGSSASPSPIFLIAFNDHTIRAVSSYHVEGRTLHYVTLQHEEQEVPLDTVDRNLSQALNRERQVPFSLPQ